MAALAVAGAATLPASASAANPRPRTARLQGQWRVQARITSASGVAGLSPGQRFSRRWTFVPLCRVGVCQSVRLIRALNQGTARLVLHRQGPGYYAGKGKLYVALRCGGQVYKKGESVPYRLTVHITQARAVAGAIVATRIKATYTNPYRTNLTPCVSVPKHVSARYRGSPMA